MLLRQQHSKRSAFTLMEIMVVVAIILILASAGVVVYTTMLADTRINRAKLDVKSLEMAVNAYMLKKGYLPETLYQLTQRDPVDGSAAYLADPKVLNDPWNQPYIYDPNSKHPQNDKPLIYSNGPPGAQQIRISNWD